MRLSRWFLLFVVGTRVLAAGQNPVPFVNQPLVPMTVAPGESGFTLTVNGTGFVSGAVVNWNGAPLSTQFVSGSQLTAVVPAANVAKPGAASVTVVNPGPGGVASNLAFFQVSESITPAFTSFIIPVASGDPNFAAVSEPLVADFNGDGRLDVLSVDNYFSTGLDTASGSLLLGNGDGTFQTTYLGWEDGLSSFADGRLHRKRQPRLAAKY
jgi:IPT/TIG domain